MEDEVGVDNRGDDTVADENGFEIAVIGMAGRFPGAANIDQYWDNLCNGVESISTFTDDELLESGIDPNLLSSPNYVKAAGSIEGAEMFDAAFFRYSPREAKTMAPQHRLLLECAYEALQHAGCDAQRYRGAIGVFAGESSNSYERLLKNAGDINRFDKMQVGIGNDRDFLSTTVSYKLNLSGPSLTIQTACSTSLATVHMAYQSLLSGDCDIALAGGVTIKNRQKVGYLYEKDGIMSPDGHCRAFDASAQGTVSGDGVGIIALKRLEDARADGDCIHAVIKGSALNNDGSHKVGFTAPSVERQADVIERAQAMAEVDPETIGYIETHGTGTILGDPIEIAALNRAFRARGSKKQQYCAIGSVKTNIGHLDAAAGIAGLIKAVLVLKNRQIPPSLHYRQPNPQIDFVNSPFYVSHDLADWQPDKVPFRAGVSSFGIGGTNAHIVLEEPPRSRAQDKGLRNANLILLSAKTDTALDRACEDLAEHLKVNPDISLADVAFTLQTGRQQFQRRRMLVCDDFDDAITALETCNPKRVIYGISEEQRRSVVFMFPGQGAQYIDMGRELYALEPGFRVHFNECCELLEPEIGIDLRTLIYSSTEDSEKAAQRINQTSITQPALFALEYSLARLLMSWGLQPKAMIGHSIGEYIAACLAGVFSLPDALSLVSARAAMMQSMEEGSMSAIPMSADEVQNLLGDGLSVAAINEPSMCVVSGSTEKLVELEAELAKQGVACRRLHTSHAFHSEMMDAVVKPFEDLVRGIEVNSPKIPYVSNLTGTWITAEDIADPAYWGRHLRNTVLFAAGLDKLFENPLTVFLEVGPGQTLSTLARGNPSRQPDHLVISSMRHPQHQSSDTHVLLNALGRLWLGGIDIDWAGFYSYESRQRVVLPGYPFERQKYWVEQNNRVADRALDPPRKLAAQKINDPEQWCYLPTWQSTQMRDVAVKNERNFSGRWMIFQDQYGVGEQLSKLISNLGGDVIHVMAGERFSNIEPGLYELNPGCQKDYQLLFDVPAVNEIEPKRIVHAWGLENGGALELDMALQLGYYSLLYLIQSIKERWPILRIHFDVITNNVQSVTGSERLYPENAFALGLCKVLRIEFPSASCRSIDIELPETANQVEQFMLSGLLGELGTTGQETQVAYRSGRRWIPSYEKANPDYVTKSPRLRENGVYLITGGVGNVGLELAEYLAKTVGARLILTARTELPPQPSWGEWLSQNDNQDRITYKIRKLKALEDMGAELMVATVDTASRAQMQTLIKAAQQRFGNIDGVIHAAGILSGPSFDLIQNLTPEKCELQLHPKVQGLLVIKELFADEALDFIMPVSSISVVLGGLGFAAYAAANQFMDTMSQQQYGLGNRNWISVDWDGWNFSKRDLEKETEGITASFALTPEEGHTVFDRVLRMGNLPQVIISTGDLQLRIDQWISHKDRPEQDIEETRSSAASVKKSEHPRPKKSATVSKNKPESEMECIIANIWEEVLGIDEIETDDMFLDLGGHSLSALTVANRFAEETNIRLDLGDLMTGTLGQLAALAEASVKDSK